MQRSRRVYTLALAGLALGLAWWLLAAMGGRAQAAASEQRLEQMLQAALACE